MDIQEELRTAYENLKGHQDRSVSYIQLIHSQSKEILNLKSRIETLQEIIEGLEDHQD